MHWPAVTACLLEFDTAAAIAEPFTKYSYMVDADDDGLKDVIVLSAHYVADAGTPVSVFWGSATGIGNRNILYVPEPYSNAYSFQGDDIDGDGDTDILGIAMPNGANALLAMAPLVFRNDGNRRFSFEPRPSVGGYRTPSAVGDLTGDGRPEYIAQTDDPNGMVVLVNMGGGNFQARPVPEPLYPMVGFVYSADVDGDGDLDIAVPEEGGGSIAIFKNDGLGNLTLDARYFTGTAVKELALGDLSGDGLPEIYVVPFSYEWRGWFPTLLTNLGNGKFSQRQLAGIDSPHTPLIADLDADGFNDVVVSSFFGGGLYLFRGDGRGGLIEHPFIRMVETVRASPRSIVAGRLAPHLPTRVYVNFSSTTGELGIVSRRPCATPR